MGKRSMPSVFGSSSYELFFKSKMAMGRLQPPRYRFHVRNSCEVSRYAILLPSGEKLVRSARGTCSIFGVPPSAGMTYTSGLPSYSPVKAIHFPSGENLGKTSSPIWEVSRRAEPPSREEIHRSPA